MKLDDDDFALFDLPRTFAQDRENIDQRWKALQSEVHPDRFAAVGGASQRLAMQWAVRVNEAHRRLRDPLSRAAYLCELLGAPINAENNTAMPASFLMEQMEWREALDEASDAAEVEALDDEVLKRERALQEHIGKLLDEQGDAEAASAEVRALMFITRFREDINRRLEQLES
ncbi:Fe-S protein assembly co-chaperone HscB [Roseateles toxinivorans]|uniref:Co-chaperone protein HscB homolog n=1 Tax=Roseateles toxinivorans TaxID=270368 RepID=A0A4R6QTV9_9BURK|nr:Fe-S protein assembly co-chaperone HscB [Roseateles toxinivorans]TDP74847.1 molecular chaperone HscB [Roseateles toxinivorans]